MADNKLESCLAIAERYGMREIAGFAERQKEELERAPFTVGIIGNNHTAMALLADLTGMEELEGIAANRSYFIEILEGDEAACFTEDGEEEKRIPLSEMKEELEKTVSLDSEEKLPALRFRLYAAPDRAVSGVRLLAAGSAEEYRDIRLQDMQLAADELCMALSASRLLAMEERRLIRKEELPVGTYFLTGMSKVMEEEGRQDVLRQLVSFVGGDGENVIRTDDREKLRQLRSVWENRSMDAEDIVRKRRERLEKEVCKSAVNRLNSLKAESERSLKEAQDLISHLENASGGLTAGREQTVRYIRMYYLEEMKTELQSELVSFHSELRENIKAGIEEEDDIRQLQNALAGYIMGEWETFIGETLKGRLEAAAARIDADIDGYIGQNAERALRQYLSEDEYNSLEDLLKGQQERAGFTAQDEDLKMSGAGVLFERNRTGTITGFLPKCVMAAGGIALLCSSFIPGALMMLIGYQMNSGAQEAAKERLLQEGREISDKCLKEVREKMGQAFAEMESAADGLVSDCYDALQERLSAVLKELRKDASDQKEKLDQLETEIRQIG